MRRFELVRLVFSGLLLVGLPAPAQERIGTRSPLDQLEPGRWDVRGAGGAELGSICLGDAMALAQLQHRGLACGRELVDVGDRWVSVRYSCAGLGSGRTVIRIETPRLVQLDSQGLASGTPFALRAQARRVGACQVAAERARTSR